MTVVDSLSNVYALRNSSVALRKHDRISRGSSGNRSNHLLFSQLGPFRPVKFCHSSGVIFLVCRDIVYHFSRSMRVAGGTDAVRMMMTMVVVLVLVVGHVGIPDEIEYRDTL